jgi:hypothetical protein
MFAVTAISPTLLNATFMANILENRVSATFSKEELDKLAVQRNAFMAIVKPKTVALNADELASLGSISVDNFVFVKDTLTNTDAEGAALLPPAIAAQVTGNNCRNQQKHTPWPTLFHNVPRR